VTRLKRYIAPKLDKYGHARELTLGATGTLPDFIVSTGPPLTISPTPADCDAAFVPPTLPCFTIVP
jgi:hypothetical protein